MATRILIIGGTRFVGRHIVEAAVAAGDEVTVFARGRSDTSWLPDIELILGDRVDDLERLANRTWDVVVDSSGYTRSSLAASTQLLSSVVGHYVFISSLSVYGDHSQPDIDEDSPTVLELRPQIGPTPYAVNKAQAELEVMRNFEGRFSIVRAGLLVGPYDHHRRFSYWPWRVAQGGRLLAPGPHSIPVQLLDARDHAAFVVSICHSRLPGIFNATSPAGSLNLESMIEACCHTDDDIELVWVDEYNLLVHVIPDKELPVWFGPSSDLSGTMLVNTDKAHSAGLQCRPLVESAADVRRWTQTVGEKPHPQWLSLSKEAKLIDWLSRDAFPPAATI